MIELWSSAPSHLLFPSSEFLLKESDTLKQPCELSGAIVIHDVQQCKQARRLSATDASICRPIPIIRQTD